MNTQRKHLKAVDDVDCIAQATFVPKANGQTYVVALLSATQYINRVVTTAEADRIYSDLIESGWVEPSRSKPIALRTLQLFIHD